MSEVRLKYIVCFLNDEKSVSEFVSQATDFFNNLHQNKFDHSIIIEKVKQSYNEFNCDSNFYEIGFTIICKNVQKNSDIESFASSISKEWCDKAKNNQYLHWLLPDRSNSFSLNHKSHRGEAKASEFAFGTMPDMKNFVQCYTFYQRGSSSILCSFSHLQRHFIIYISNMHKTDCIHTGEMGHKMIIKYDSLLRIVADVNPSKPAAELFLHMEHPPLIYVTHGNKQSTEDKISVQDSISASRRISKAKEMQYSFDKFERTFSLGCTCNHTFCDSRLKMGKAPVLKIVINDKFQARWLINQLILRHAKKTEICLSSMNTVKIHDSLKDLKKFPLFSNFQRTLDSEDQFNCEYAWKSLNSKSLFIFHQITLKSQLVLDYAKDLKYELSHCASKNPTAVAKALFELSDMVDKGIMFIFHSVFKRKFNYFCNFVELNKLPKGMCYVRRVIITPSKVIFLRPYEHFDNRVIRKFGVEYMLRVSVQDDNFQKLTYAVQYNSKKEFIMNEVVSKILNNGISIGFRNYEVLACSSSQLREHGLCMYAKDSNGNTASSIRNWMGDFSEIKNVPKYMARMGQCLSTTEEGVQVCLDAGSEALLDEVKTKNGRYIFSDGIGRISVDLANEVRAALLKNKGYDENEPLYYQPSAFQIRYKGCKGMVAEYPAIKGRVIEIRPSMNKFKCKTSDHLEIVKTSAPRKLFLNKHLITILEQMGIPKETFIDLQSDMMLHLLDSLMDETEAASLLAHALQMDFPFEELCKAGISLTTEPFFRTLLLSVFKASSATLQSSMRIAIPEKYGRNMLGVLDETKTLKYGQVFIQYSVSTYPNAPLKILKGPVIVTKNPCLHPGDVRKLSAVDVEGLHHIKDCIVFPAEGKRPHPDEMGGSDLDGDEFVVLWHKNLIFKQKSFKPMDYPVYEEKFISHNIELKDMVDFFCEYIQNDCIGSFANAHLMWADYLRDGIFSQKCMNIAKHYPYVLDFAKHGTTKYLKKSERPDQYPDFMQKGLTANTYYSKKALGSLYRSSRVMDACSSKISLSDLSKMETLSFDPDLAYPGWEEYESSAEMHHQKYTDMVNEILHKYGISIEAEAFTGFVDLKFAKKWRQEKSDAIIVIKSYMRSIMQTFRYIFLKEVQKEVASGDSDAKIKKYQRASAWYMVAYSKGKKSALSFPWILSDILIKIKLNKNTQDITKENFLNDIDIDIQACIASGIINSDLLDSPETCKCRNLSRFILFEWLSQSKLNICSRDKHLICESCFERIIKYFWSNSNVYCCTSSDKMNCKCSETCSPTKLILVLLKFFIKKTNHTLGKCNEDGCDGFIARNLQELSLQTLSYLAITRNIYYLGLNFKTANFTKKAYLEEELIGPFEEGSPLKIPVKTDTLKNVIENYRDEVIAYLEKNSGVHHIVLQPDRDLHDNLCIIINSLGKAWQRWNLEEILLDPEFTNKILCELNIDNSA